jgi:hypothetical protein
LLASEPSWCLFALPWTHHLPDPPISLTIHHLTSLPLLHSFRVRWPAQRWILKHGLLLHCHRSSRIHLLSRGSSCHQLARSYRSDWSYLLGRHWLPSHHGDPRLGLAQAMPPVLGLGLSHGLAALMEVEDPPPAA